MKDILYQGVGQLLFKKKDSLKFQNILKKAEICITVPRDMLRQREFFPLYGKHTGNNDHQ